jgi:hypothetical protein
LLTHLGSYRPSPKHSDEPPPLIPTDEPVASTSTLPSSTQTDSSSSPLPPPQDYPTSSADPSASTSSASPTAPTEASLDADIARSTLKLLLETGQQSALFLLWALGVFLVAKLIKWTSTYPFRALTWTITWILFLLERAIYYIAWLSNWLSIIAGVLLVLFIILIALSYAVIANEAALRRLLEPRSVRIGVIEGGVHLPILLAWLWLPRWVSWPLLAFAAFRLGAKALGRDWIAVLGGLLGGKKRVKVEALDGSPSPSAEQARKAFEEKITAMKAEQERAKEDREADRWATLAREEMLKESLSRRAKKATEHGTEEEVGLEEGAEVEEE